MSENYTKFQFIAMKMLHKYIKRSAKFGKPNADDMVNMTFYVPTSRIKLIEFLGGMPINELVNKFVRCLESGSIIVK